MAGHSSSVIGSKMIVFGGSLGARQMYVHDLCFVWEDVRGEMCVGVDLKERVLMCVSGVMRFGFWIWSSGPGLNPSSAVHLLTRGADSLR